MAITGMNRTVKTLVYREASKLEEHAGKEFNTGKFQHYWRSK